MNSFQIACFVEAARCGSFSDAASKLFVSQPTLSRNVSSLEKELGLPLFDRNTFQGIELTEQGGIMLEAFTSAQKIISEAAMHAKSVTHEEKVAVNLGLLHGQMLDDALYDFIGSFKLQNPNAEMGIRHANFDELMAWLQSGEIDATVMPEWQLDGLRNLTLTHICDLPTVLVVPKRALPHPERRTYSLREFEDNVFICVDANKDPHSTELLVELLGELGISPHLRTVPNIEAQIHTVEMGEGVMLINPYNSICYSPSVICVEVAELRAQPFALAWRKHSQSAAVKLLRTFVSQSPDMGKKKSPSPVPLTGTRPLC